HVGEGLRHPGHHLGVVVAQVVAPAEGVVYAAPVIAWHVALEVALDAAEEIDIRRELAAVLAGEDTACRYPGLLEHERIGAVGREEDVVLPDRVEVVDSVVAPDRRWSENARRHRGARVATEQGDAVLRVEDARDVVWRGRYVGVQIVLDLGEFVGRE